MKKTCFLLLTVLLTTAALRASAQNKDTSKENFPSTETTLSQIGQAEAHPNARHVRMADTSALAAPVKRPGLIRRIIDYYSRSNVDRTFEKKIDWSIAPGPNYSSDVGFGIGFLLGQGIGRWGNFFNQEAFGCNTNSIFGMSGGRIQEWITDQYPSTTYFANFGTALDASQPVHPCFLYESVWCLLGFVLLALFAKKIRRYDGQIFLIYICWYGAERAVVEGLRTDSLVIGNVRVSQILAICCVVVSVILQIAIGTKVKRMGVDYHMYKDTAESKRMLAEYEAGKTGADTTEDSESNETESTDDTTDTTTEADASDASADNDDTATENCENENEKE